MDIIQIIVGVLLVISVLMQTKGTGLSNLFGGSGSSIHRTKRGVEKWIWYSTMVLTTIFVLLTLISLFQA
ncbi:preprotein translocase subunit SecG [candidate division WWE3 bacterium RIFCSPLOWO2_01_FULL_42_11]|uniref:Protein-export membrane protein SecG n=1 Tax=candidate division WWE3 bacterium RIFCSPLOWO2_01_FULL_42_11 TaxID=1802627 RepID=A0A1F4VQ50_UNCKA|nr:MAG: preprotein translocase subunit SecG [candidate division WWE3 bacterium RIFCSPLOWO2_01_FULL_42_11]